MPDHGQRVAHHSTISDRWYVSPRSNAAADVRLFFFPYAGGGPSAFTAWVDKLPGNVEAWFAHFPGRGSRFNEPPIRSMESLVNSLSQTIQPLTDKPFAFFGHSLGAMVAFELARQLRQMNLPQPHLLFVSACGAPQVPDPHPRIHALPDSEFVRSLEEYNGTPAEVLQHPGMMQLLIPMIRADVEVFENYSFKSGEPPLDFPIIAFGGTDDPRVSRERLEGWAVQTNASFEIQYFPGDHFFVNSARDLIIRSISEATKTFLAGKDSSI